MVEAFIPSFQQPSYSCWWLNGMKTATRRIAKSRDLKKVVQKESELSTVEVLKEVGVSITSFLLCCGTAL
tara:strand:- start:260 stop:469 length:210 start_codon:yes stop_codon:yes gene_type:complete